MRKKKKNRQIPGTKPASGLKYRQHQKTNTMENNYLDFLLVSKIDTSRSRIV